VNLEETIKETLSLLSATLPPTIDIRAHLLAPRPVVLADPTQMHQVLMNLAGNAEHAMREAGGVLEVRLEQVEIAAPAPVKPALEPGVYVKLTVSDSGVGIPAELLERVFDPFFTTKEVGEGVGLGLSVVHGIIANHGGAIAVESAAGRGTAFVIHLPIAGGPVSEESSGASKNGRERVLFVDDEEAVASLGRYMLEHVGYTAEVYTSGRAALQAFATSPARYNLVVTDQNMPGMTGMELSEHLLRLRRDLPIVLCTGYSEAVTLQRAREIGIRALLMKPIDPDELAQTLRSLLEQSRPAAVP
jgi:CheY-like chemotaxis protein